jgi:hypothetical protein
VKTIDLRLQQISLDELLDSVGGDVVRITNKDGDEFVLEAADVFEREASELGRSAKFMAFLAERSAEPARTSLADIESRLADAPSRASDEAVVSEQDPSPRRRGPAA